MQGYSFRSLTDLVLKIFKTKITAGTGLSGGGSLETDRTLTVNYGTIAGTAAQGNDSRLSDSREWKEATITQAEAEAGVVTTRRAFTAQRVRQAIVAWWNSITGVFGRDLVTSANDTIARSKLGLGTAATANLTTSIADGTIGRVLKVGDGGWMGRGDTLGAPYGYPSSETDITHQTKVIRSTAYDNGIPPFATGIHFSSENTWGRLRVSYNSQVAWIQGGEIFSQGGWTSQIVLSANMLQTTGTSTDFPMSQAAVTNQLATKANTSTQVIAGTGLTGGGDLSANRTLNVSYGTTAGTSVQGNDIRVVNALQGGNNLSDTTNKTLARGNLGLGTAATATLTTSTTDGTVGRVLKVGDFGVGSPTTLPGVTDLNTFTINGSYDVDRAVNRPTGSVDWGYLRVIGHAAPSTHCYQEWTELNSVAARTYYRVYVSGSWQDWREIYHTGNMPATATRWPTWGEVSDKPTIHTPIGVDQTWQNMIGSRVAGVTYTNTTGRTIMANVSVRNANTSAGLSIDMFVNEEKVDGTSAFSTNSAEFSTVSGVIPPGGRYSVSVSTSDIVNMWTELR